MRDLREVEDDGVAVLAEDRRRESVVDNADRHRLRSIAESARDVGGDVHLHLSSLYPRKEVRHRTDKFAYQISCRIQTGIETQDEIIAAGEMNTGQRIGPRTDTETYHFRDWNSVFHFLETTAWVQFVDVSVGDTNCAVGTFHETICLFNKTGEQDIVEVIGRLESIY